MSCPTSAWRAQRNRNCTPTQDQGQLARRSSGQHATSLPMRERSEVNWSGPMPTRSEDVQRTLRLIRIWSNGSRKAWC